MPPPVRPPVVGDRPKHTARASVPRRALRWPTEVAEALGVSDDWLRDRGLAAEIPMVRVGTLRLVPIAALDAWLAARACLPLDPPQGCATGGAVRSPADTGDAMPSETRMKRNGRSR
jgi:excisionase family DNA binding protein